MAEYDTVLIRYGELTTKGKNRKDFIRKLDQNIRGILKDFEGLVFRRGYDRYAREERRFGTMEAAQGYIDQVLKEMGVQRGIFAFQPENPEKHR